MCCSCMFDFGTRCGSVSLAEVAGSASQLDSNTRSRSHTGVSSFHIFHALLILSRSLPAFVVSKLIAKGLSERLRLDQELNDFSQSLFQKGKSSFLVFFRSGGCLLYSFTMAFRLRVIYKNGWKLLCLCGSHLSTFQSKSRWLVVCGS